MCFARVPLAPGDGLAGNQILPPHRPLATLPTSVHRRPLASRPIPVPPLHVCVSVPLQYAERGARRRGGPCGRAPGLREPAAGAGEAD